MYLAMLGNTGVLNCYGAPPFEGKGALSNKDPRYRGEVFVEGEGAASIREWSPNRVAIDVRGASAGARVVYNMNYDKGFQVRIDASGESQSAEVENVRNTLSAKVPVGDSTVTFAYSPPGLREGLFVFFVSALVLAWKVRRERVIVRGQASS